MNNPIPVVTLMIIAIVSGLLNFAGLTTVLHDGWYGKALAAMSSLAVFAVIYSFWSFAFNTLPHLKSNVYRICGWLATSVGCVGIILISTYWNTIVFAGHEVEKIAFDDTTRVAEIQLSEATETSGQYESIVPQVTALSASVHALSKSEIENGAISGTAGEGSISNTLLQVGENIGTVSTSLTSSQQTVNNLAMKGRVCLTEIRQAYNSISFSKGVDCVNSVIAALNNQNVATQIAQSLEAITSGIVLPSTIKTDAQKQTVSRILDGIQAQANEIAAHAKKLDMAQVDFVSNERPNTAQAVLLHWRSIIPSIATALAIDLLPLVLLIFVVLYKRDAALRNENTSTTTLRDVERIHHDLRRIDDLRGERPFDMPLMPPNKEGDSI